MVGVSGGADSVALLHLLVEAGFSNLIVCHLDHRLRNRASTGDARFVKRLCSQLNIPCEIGRADVVRQMEIHHESMETAARNARHAFFAECSEKFKCPRVVLAHHADDQAETILWNLLRGSHGLKAMREVNLIESESAVHLEIHRPLLGLRRAELIEWLKSRKLRWREDSTNAEPVAVRNRLRNEALPLLTEISGRDVTESLLKSAADASEHAALEAWAVSQTKALDPQGRVHLPVLRTLPTALQRAVLAAFLKHAGVPSIDRALVFRALELIDPAGPHAVNLPGGGWLRRRAGRLLVEWPEGK